MADMNYVSPLTSDLTDYYTKSEVDELQQGDAATYATSAEIVAGDNAVKGWVVSQGFLTEHQDLTNYATISYVDDAIAAIEPSSGGMAVRVVSTLPAVGEENVLYLVFVDNEEEDNRYAEYIWVDTLNDYEMLGFSSSKGGIIPDLTDYATKQWVEAKGYLVSDNLIGYATVSNLADFATKDYVDDELANKANAADLAAVATSGDYDDLSNKPTIPDISNLAAADISFSNPDKYTIYDNPTVQSVLLEVDNNAVRKSSLSTVATTGSYNDLTNKPAIPTVPANVSAFTNDAGYLTAHQDISGKANTADLATVAFSGDYDDLANKPSIPSTSGLASESYVNNAIANINIPDVSNFIDAEQAESIAADEVEHKMGTLSTVAVSGSYNDLTDKPTIPAAPDLTPYATKQELTAKADTASLASVATSGSYNDLSDKPIIPSEGLSQILGDNFFKLFAFQSGQNISTTAYVEVSNSAQVSDAIKKGLIFIPTATQIGINYPDFTSQSFVEIYTYYGGDFDRRVVNSPYVWSGMAYVRVGDNTLLGWDIDKTKTNKVEKLRTSILKAFTKNQPYSNTASGLTATTIQGAIDELAAASGGGSSVGWQYDSSTGYMTFTGMSEDDGR